MFGNLKIGIKLALGFGLVLVLAILLGVIGIYQMWGVGSMAKEVAEIDLPSVESANKAERNALMLMFEARAYNYTADESFLNMRQERVSTVIDEAGKVAEVAKSQNLPKRLEAAQETIKNLNTYDKMLTQTQEYNAKIREAKVDMDRSADAFMKAVHDYETAQYTAYQNDLTENATTDKLKERMIKIRGIAEVAELGNGCRVDNFKGQAFRDATHINEAMPKFDQIHKEIEAIRQVTRSKADLDALDRIQIAAQQYQAAMKSTVESMGGIQALGAERVAAAGVVLESTKNMAEVGLGATNESMHDSQAALSTASTIMIGGLVVVTILGAALAYLITRIIVNPIKVIVDRIKDIAQGEGDLTKRVEIKSKDEVGELAQWFNTFVEKLHGIISQVAGATNEVAGAATEIAANAEEMSSGMQEQSQQVAQVSSAIEEMSASVVEVARKSADAAGNAEASGKAAEEGGSVVAETVQGMDAISEAVSSSAISVQELGKRGE